MPINNWNNILWNVPQADPPLPDPVPHDQQFYNDVNAIANEYMKTYGQKSKTTRSISQSSDEYRALANQITELEGSIHQELGELERVLETIATQAEVVRDIGSTVQSHISILRTVAIRLETWRSKMLPPDSLGSVTTQAAGLAVPEPAHPPAGVAAQQVAPGLWQQGQV